MRILLIEDDSMIGRAVRAGLTDAGFSVDWVLDGRAAELSLANGHHDLAVLDLGLPNKDGMEVLASVRAAGSGMPVLIASARDGVGDRIAGLNAGADDYVLKPFDLDELIARIRAVLRRHAGGCDAAAELRRDHARPGAPRRHAAWRSRCAVGARVRRARGLDAAARRGAVAPEARRVGLSLGRRSRQQCHRSAPAQPAQEARQRHASAMCAASVTASAGNDAFAATPPARMDPGRLERGRAGARRGVVLRDARGDGRDLRREPQAGGACRGEPSALR